jgi:hypothetical protein
VEVFESVSAFFNSGVSLQCNASAAGVSYSFFLSHTSKICILVCMAVGKMRNVFALGQNLQFVCAEA